MKKYNNIFMWLCAGALALSSCSDFEDINKDPQQAQGDQAKAYYALNKSILDTQMGPHEAERIFVYNWKSAARFHQMGFLVTGTYSDDYNDDYLNSRVASWMKYATLAINLADQELASGDLSESQRAFTENVKQVSRIWFAYLTSEYVDNFGVAPTGMELGVVPEFKTCKEVYTYALSELKDAASKIDVKAEVSANEKKADAPYGFDFTKWIKYSNSLRMRLAMRMSEIDPQLAKTEFEDAAKGELIKSVDDIFKVVEKDVWDNLGGVMSRSWNQQCVSMATYNIMTGLGGVSVDKQLTADRYLEKIKPANYLGLYLPNHFSEYSDNPSKQFFMDGIPEIVDPRAFKLYFLPNDKDAENYSSYADNNYNTRGDTNLRGMIGAVAKDTVAFINPDLCWNGVPNGYGGPKYSKNQLLNTKIWGAYPSLSDEYRRSDNNRVFFGDWETWFLLAEGAVRGWNAGVDAKTAYENGIMASFVYNKCTEYFSDYVSSTSYNRVGTSVKFDHTAEPPASVEMDYVDGYTGKAGKFSYQYPVASKTLYGKALNDKLAKIITQKYLAQMPYLPLEAWSDHRRLGLPFFEIPSAEEPLPYMPDWSVSAWKNGQKVSLYPQRLRFPTSLNNADPAGYAKAVQLLGGTDNTLTPLWWAKH